MPCRVREQVRMNFLHFMPRARLCSIIFAPVSSSDRKSKLLRGRCGGKEGRLLSIRQVRRETIAMLVVCQCDCVSHRLLLSFRETFVLFSDHYCSCDVTISDSLGRKFAHNVGVRFETPEVHFLGAEEEPYTLGFDPNVLRPAPGASSSYH